jgi:16S rRNA (adenine1518-N6/adenine1519-N6)-dimethyltransferase
VKRGTRARPRWGQNFLVAPDVAAWIANWASIEGCRVLEIGPGRGALTKPLLERAAFVRAVEIDRRLAEHLASTCGGAADRLEVVVGDALIETGDRIVEPGMHVVANLPYESATAIIRMLLDRRPPVADIVVMVQREVCQRLAAKPGSKEYGPLGVHTHLRADVETGRVVPPGCFRPQPRVESQVIRLRPLGRLRYDVGDEELFRRIIAAAFGMRRKMLRNSLLPFLGALVGVDAARRTMEALGIDPSARPETVSVESFGRLSRRTYEIWALDA